VGTVYPVPYMCVVSGNSYEKEAISEHVALCYKRLEYFINRRFDDIQYNLSDILGTPFF
jgi:hypothetical protein